MFNDNPYMSDEYSKHVAMLPADHPARKQGFLTPLQSIVLPVLMWFFDSNSNFASGRSYLTSIMLIELAIKYGKVNLCDLSTIPLLGDTYQQKSRFVDSLGSIIVDKYPMHKLSINRTSFVLKYEGMKND